MVKYAMRTCTVCGLRRPQYDMKQVKKKVKSGQSGISVSISGKPTAQSTRINSGRNYYRDALFWECANSGAHNDPSYFVRKKEEERIHLIQTKINESQDAYKKEIRSKIEEGVNNFLSDDESIDILSIYYKETDEYKKICEIYNDDILKKYNIKSLSFDNFMGSIISHTYKSKNINLNKDKLNEIFKKIIFQLNNNVLIESNNINAFNYLKWTRWLLYFIGTSLVLFGEYRFFMIFSILSLIFYVIFKNSFKNLKSLTSKFLEIGNIFFNDFNKIAVEESRNVILKSNFLKDASDIKEIDNYFNGKLKK
jgi:hypothetical protein